MTHLTAEQARVNMLEAQGMNGAFMRAETDSLLTKIAEASKKGQSSITTSQLDTVIDSRLRNLGYKVKWINGDLRDLGYTSISW